MAAVVVEIAEAVVEALEGATLSQSFIVARGYMPPYDLKEFTDGEIRATVIPAELDLGARDLKPRAEMLWTIGIWVQAKAFPETGEFDPLMLLVEEVFLLFHGWRTELDRRVVGLRAMPPFDRETPQTTGLFSAAVMVTFRVVR